MPDALLIDSLESVRNGYAQRLKTANGLVAAFKTMSSAHGKLAKLLRDYSEQTPAADPERLHYSQQAVGNFRVKEDVSDVLLPDLRREIKALTALNTALKGIVGALKSTNVEVGALGHAYESLRKLNVQDEALQGLLPQVESELKKAQQALGETFGEALRAALAERNIVIGGRAPTFEIGRFELNANFLKRRASLAYGKLPVNNNVPIGVESVLKAYDQATKAIMGRNEKGEVWIRQFHDAWENARRRRNTQDKRANIIDCYFELFLLRQKKGFLSVPEKKTVVDYSPAQFAYDLYEFGSHQQLRANGERVHVHTATRSQVDSGDRALWVVEGSGPNDGRYIGDIVFSRDE
ncbi:MAG: hypothetical protein ACYDBJ_23830 [Aggregatilineales bacterium]